MESNGIRPTTERHDRTAGPAMVARIDKLLIGYGITITPKFGTDALQAVAPVLAYGWSWTEPKAAIKAGRMMDDCRAALQGAHDVTGRWSW